MSHNNESAGYEMFIPRINDVAQKYIEDLLTEKERLPKEFPLCAQVIDDAIDRIYATGRIPGKELHADVYKQLPMKVTQNVHLPVKQYPKFNFMGKLIGPRGSTLKQLNQETLCHIGIKGRSSMRDEEKEEALRQSGNPAFNHLNKNLYVEISTVAPPAEAYARIGYALAEIRKYIIPDKNDEISQEQYRELLEMHPEYARNRPIATHRSAFSKLQSVEGFSRASRYPEYEEYEDEYETIPPPPPPPTKHYNNYKTAPPRRPEASVYHERREFRLKPYPGYPRTSTYRK
ncbi:KH domain-containing, RNA-binding, signal transduction-associated protein 3 [Stomoxys calcitrans]|uniref:K Homology domain-containing protein n=1 Tax=Stomoxys calcitrans TaxID=35570 RepID=A0A1I8PG37_STOCA|nr:KH domain-containing, RNA-binding, signal transduction-associated protein 3 [Stomoxys calcitrans]